MSRVVLAMSGGVDSSVAAHLLRAQGHDVIGVFMRHGHQSPVACEASASGRREPAETERPLPIINRLDHKQGCCTAADAEDARRVADRLDIPFYALNLDAQFGQIIDYFVREYTAARTPNPCIVCNHWIKFGKLFHYADGVGAEFVATGHYARVGTAGDGQPALFRGQDMAKDQSYVLFGIDRKLLPRMLLPVGAYEKSAIRATATELGLRVADKPDSQEICFVTEGRYDEFVRAHRTANNNQPASDDLSASGHHLASGRCKPAVTPPVTPPAPPPDTSGDIVTTDGTIVGTHRGIEGFTIGQRKGLGVALGEPRYVVRIEPDTRRVVIGEREDLARSALTASDANWHIDPPTPSRRCQAQIRYSATAVPATVEVLPAARLRVTFDAPQFGVAPGQAVVCYDGDRVLGGGWIE